MKHIHILGVCGTFMGSLAQLAIAKGYRVTGCDANVYPPMSLQLETAGIELIEGFATDQLSLQPDIFIIGNAISRGNPLLEAILNAGLPYTSGPQWLSDHILQGKWVLAVSGTHGKTTTSSMLAWVLEYANMSPGYLIGGVPKNFSVSARLGKTPFFVIEADEYDSAFFDKRSKFVHYRPRTLVINNLEFDHADIFDDLAAIQRQFHHVVRTIPENGRVITPDNAPAIDAVIAQGCWSETASMSQRDSSASWYAEAAVDTTVDTTVDSLMDSATAEGDCFDVYYNGSKQGQVNWKQLGAHNVANGLAAIAAAHHVGVTAEVSCEALSNFEGVKRRMECVADIAGTKIYDDFAHHPSAIAATLIGLRKKVGKTQIIAVIEPQSNTMRMGIHAEQLAASVAEADQVLWFSPPSLEWDINRVISASPTPSERFDTLAALVTRAVDIQAANTQSHIVVMSNGGFGGVHGLLTQALHNALLTTR
ncbi:MAG: UDP-N-acetylmuramate: L-alanyl-gamma-D-glutamyl-meso-diaminopimelate ligase [Candidatus Endobugula sp.]|jgi:UDP-N-acetylmuramate: L-alanyl-gamma-D-glutamyl-meso-diaminopimelate ligase